jgi:hypothetical protein
MRFCAALLASVFLTLTPPSAGAQSPAAPHVAAVDAQVALNAYQGLVEEYLTGVLRGARAIALSSAARSANWDEVKPMLDRLSDDLDTDATVWFALPDGRYYSTEAKGLTDQNLKDRSYFHGLMAGEDVESALVVSKSTGHRSVIVATPVKENGKVVAAIGVSLRVRLISQLVEKHTHLPADMYFYSLNADALISTHRNIDRIFKHPTDIGDESIGPAFASSLASDKGRLDYPLLGKKISAIFQKSSILGWHFFIAQESR